MLNAIIKTNYKSKVRTRSYAIDRYIIFKAELLAPTSKKWCRVYKYSLFKVLLEIIQFMVRF